MLSCLKCTHRKICIVYEVIVSYYTKEIAKSICSRFSKEYDIVKATVEESLAELVASYCPYYKRERKVER